MKAINVWNTFGIRTSPFFQEALDLSIVSQRPIDLFVGRDNETEDVLRRIIGTDSSRTVIAGTPGVGKTTFIQHVKAKLAEEHGFAVSSEYCRVPHIFSVMALGVEMLRSILRSLRTALPRGRPESLSGFREAKELVETTERTAVQGSVSVLGTGVGAGGGRSTERPLFRPSQFHEALAQLAAGAIAAGTSGIVVHLNNVENLESDTQEAGLLFRDARDYFLVPGLHLVLGATDSLFGSVISTHAQVRDIFPTPMHLGSLDYESVMELLDKRVEHLRIDREMEALLPITPDLVKEMFDIFNGDLRGMLSALEEACLRALATLRPEPLSSGEALLVLAPLYREHLRSSLSRTDFEHLVTLFRLGLDEFRQADVIEPLGLSQPRVSGLLAVLERNQAIIPTRTDGRSQYFTIAGRARLALEERLS